jgi:hypothetical protein
VIDAAEAVAELENARSLEQQALVALREAEGELAHARQAFAAAPAAELEERVESAEREARRADRWAQARTLARARAEEVHAEAVREAARAELARIDGDRAAVTEGIGEVLDELERLHDRLAGVVERAHTLCARDAELAAAGARVAEAAGMRARTREALTVTTVRIAAGIRIDAEWERAEPPPVVSLGEFDGLVAGLASEPGDLPDRAARMFRVHEHWLATVGADAGAWLLRCPEPRWDAGGSYLVRRSEAGSLLTAIERTRTS